MVIWKPKKTNSLPGFKITLSLTLFYWTLVVLMPLLTLFGKAGSLGTKEFIDIVTSSRVLASFRLSLWVSLLAASFNACIGFLIAWVLVRYEFPGRRFIDGLVDLPFALPTAVAGIALTSIYSPNGLLGRPLASLGIRVAFTPIGIVLALTFVGLPFVVRTVQPVLQNLDSENAEAAVSLGADRWQVFARVILPNLLPATITGFALAFARALGEYGSVAFISGNLPWRTEVPSLLIMTKLEQFDYSGAAAIALVMLTASFFMLLFTHFIQRWGRRHGLWV